jgi:hypothetical protein
MAAHAQVPVIAIERYRVEHGEGFTMPVVSLTDRRAAGNRLVRFVFQRHLETVLYGRSEGSSGPIWKVMNQAGIGATTLAVSKANVASGLITDAEYSALLDCFKSALPADVVDPSSLGRIRQCTILPLAAAATVVRTFGRSPASMAWLRSLSQPIPQAWELRDQQEANNDAGHVDLALNEKLDDAGFEAEEMSFAQELQTMPAFSADKDDDERLKTYILQRVPPMLKTELERYLLYRTETFAARRQGGAVQSISAEADNTALLRFFGWMQATNRPTTADSITFMIRPDLGDIAQEYVRWLQTTQRCKFSTIANYINGLVSITSYCYANLAPNDALLAMDPNPLTQLINLRGQAEKASKTQQLYEKRVGGWMEWEEVQKARIAATSKLAALGEGGASAAKRNLLRDCAALSLLSLIPPDRVGCIRKLRLGHTLKKKPSGSGWMMDLSHQRDGHKTSRFYGPFAASLPNELTPILDQYTDLFAFEMDGDSAYLFHPPQSGFDRPMESSSWSQWVGRLFQRHAGVTIAPKTLRSIFITWLRNNTSAPDVLKSAAHAQKHSEARQASEDYDQQADDRLVKAAYDFNLKFIAEFETSAAANAAAGGSSSVADAAAGGGEDGSEGGGEDAPPPAAAAAAAASSSSSPPRRAGGPVPSRQLPPIQQAEVNGLLADVGFSKSKAKGNGDCYPLSAMAGFEISRHDARMPKTGTTATVRELRDNAISILTGDEAIDGITATTFRAGEKLPEDGDAAHEVMAAWLEPGFWNSGDGNKFGSFMLAIALHLGRPIAVLEKSGKAFLNPAKVYGARAADGSLLHSTAKPGAPETVPTFKLMPIAELVEQLRTSPLSCSVLEFNGANHFDPWLLKPSLRAAAEAAVEAGESADGGGEVAADTEEEEEEQDVDMAVPAALVDDEWIEMAGGPWVARLMRKARQSAAPPGHRVFGVNVTFSSATPIYSGGAVKFMNVPGGPELGIVCATPNVPLPGAPQQLMFMLILSELGAPDNSVSIPSVFYRRRMDDDSDSDGDGGSPRPPPRRPPPSDAAAAAEADAEADEAASAIRSNHLELNGPPVPASLAPLAAAARETLCRSTVPLPGEGEAAVELHADAAAAAAASDLPAPPAPPDPPPPPPSASRPQRERKRKAHYGDNGELDGTASSFRSAPSARKASLDASVETEVPDFASIGEEVWAWGLHAGARRRFKAEVVKHRKQFPRLVVRYIATEAGGSHRLELPDPITAYLHAADVAPKDW